MFFLALPHIQKLYESLNAPGVRSLPIEVRFITPKYLEFLRNVNRFPIPIELFREPFDFQTRKKPIVLFKAPNCRTMLILKASSKVILHSNM